MNTRALVFCSMMGLGSCFTLFAAPQGEMVMQGQASFQRDGLDTQIVASHGSIIHYSNFDIASNESVTFIQPSAESCVLNRVFSDQTTMINGSLTANGRVYLVNPNGIFFGNEAIVNATALFAIAGNFLDEHFQKGIHEFTDLSASIINEGFIQAQTVGLFGEMVANHGNIVSHDGLIALVSGNSLLLGEKEGRLFAKIEQPAQREDSEAIGLENTGNIDAGLGEVFLGASDIYKFAIETNGRLKGKRVTCESQGTVIVQGSIDASDEQNRGGDIALFGRTISLMGATLDASGETGGGEILIGGDLRGLGPHPNAHTTLVDNTTVIKADALSTGDGGTVIVWSDKYTLFGGEISASGGALSGNGGFVETSSKQGLAIEGHVSALAPMGNRGVWLLDPEIILIISGGSGTYTGPVPFTAPPNSSNGTLLLNVSTINAASVDIVLQSEGAISAGLGIDIALANAHNITMNAGGDIFLNQITSSGGDITLSAGDPGAMNPSDVASVTAIQINTTSFSSNGGNVTITATGDIIVQTIINTTGNNNGGAISLTSHNGSVFIPSLLSIGGSQNGGNITIQSSPTMVQGPLGPEDWRPIGKIIFSTPSPIGAGTNININAFGAVSSGDVVLNPADRSHLPSIATITSDPDAGMPFISITNINNFTVGNFETISLTAPIQTLVVSGTVTTGDLYMSTLVNNIGISIHGAWQIIKHPPHFVVEFDGTLARKDQTIIAIGGNIGPDTTTYPAISGFSLTQAPTTIGSGADPIFYDASNVTNPFLASFTETILPEFTGFSQSALYNSSIALTPSFTTSPTPPSPSPAAIELLFAQLSNIPGSSVPMPYMDAWKDSINRWNDALALQEEEETPFWLYDEQEEEEKAEYKEKTYTPLLPPSKNTEEKRHTIYDPFKRRLKI